MPPSRDDLLSFKAFLSHRYKSPTFNRYFFRIFAEAAEVQFEVDEGAFATSVTRLERMIRGCDAFIGIYPFHGKPGVAERAEQLHQSRYFRLELDLAIRARRPGLIFYDRRYRQLFRCPSAIHAVEFDPLEIDSPGGSPSSGLYRRTFRSFCERVAMWQEFDVASRAEGPHANGVIIVVPPGARGTLGYSAREIDLISSVLAEHGYDDVSTLRWPPVLDGETLTRLHDADWVLTDVGHGAVSAVVAYLHGSFVPMMRLRRVPRGPEQPEPIDFLHGGVEVGYGKDILSWSNPRSLAEGLHQRLLALDAPLRRMNTTTEAEEYFRSAALRKEAVFLSYSGRDQEAAGELSAALKERFRTVFDYRDGASIRPGKPWLEEIFMQLSGSAIGIPLLSTAYVESGNCLHEMREMVARRDGESMRLIPIKIDQDLDAVPTFASDTQYLRRWDFDRPDEVVEKIINVLA